MRPTPTLNRTVIAFGSGSVDQAIETTSGTFIEQEPNDDISEANGVQLGTIIQGRTRLLSDFDYFRIQIPDTQDTVTVSITAILRRRSSGELEVAAYDVRDGLENQLASAEIEPFSRDERPATFRLNAAPGDTYYFRVRSLRSVRLPQTGALYELEVRQPTD